MNLKRLFQRSQEDRELARELESHLEHEIDDNLARGLTPDEARRQASIKLGNQLSIRDQVWSSNGIAWLEDTWRDLCFGARTLRKTPGFSCVALLVMALGIGANTAIYSFLDSLLLRSLPVHDPSSLVVVNWHAKSDRDTVMESMSGSTYDDSRLGIVSGIFPYPAFELFEKQSTSFSDIFAHCRNREVQNLDVVMDGQAEIASGDLVSGNYFAALGIAPRSGRLVIPEDDLTGAPAVAVLSFAFSEKHFADVNPAGRSIIINNLPFTIIGVAPPEFFGVDPSFVPDIYLPMHTNVLLGAQIPFGITASDYLDPNYYWVEVMARLRPGVSLRQAEAELAPKFQSWVASTAHNDRERADLPVLYLREGASGLDTLRRRFSRPLYVLMTLVALILAIACSNVANLQLARAAARRREIAVRISEGASRLRIIRQLLTESVLLSALGGALGVLLALGAVRFLSTLLGGNTVEVPLKAELNWHVLAVATALALTTGILFGLIPALQSARVDLVSALKETRAGERRTSHSRRRPSFTQILVIGQIALSLLMLFAAGLFVRTLLNLQSVNLGFNRENLLLFDLNARQTGHQDPEVMGFYERLRESFAALPGVQSAGLAQGSPIRGENQVPISLPGQPTRPDTRYLSVGPEFLTTMQIPILFGRDIHDSDGPGSPPVAVINEEFAHINFPGQNPIGRRLRLWKDGQEKELARDMEIVGIARNSQYGSISQKVPPVVYIAYNQGFPLPSHMLFALRTTGDPVALVNSVRQVVHQADPRLPVAEVRTQATEVKDSMHQEIVLAQLCSLFAALALTIACVGLYGTLSYTVSRRTGELGIRMALGAERSSVLWMVLREVFQLAVIGVALSVPVALAASKFVSSFLFGMKPNDPLALSFSVTLLLGAALLAGGIPARRAASIEPMAALRHE